MSKENNMHHLPQRKILSNFRCNFKVVPTRPVTSLGHQGGEKFSEWPNTFKLCQIVLNYVQHIFPGGGEKFCWGLIPSCAPPGYGPVTK